MRERVRLTESEFQSTQQAAIKYEAGFIGADMKTHLGLQWAMSVATRKNPELFSQELRPKDGIYDVEVDSDVLKFVKLDSGSGLRYTASALDLPKELERLLLDLDYRATEFDPDARAKHLSLHYPALYRLRIAK